MFYFVYYTSLPISFRVEITACLIHFSTYCFVLVVQVQPLPPRLAALPQQGVWCRVDASQDSEAPPRQCHVGSTLGVYFKTRSPQDPHTWLVSKQVPSIHCPVLYCIQLELFTAQELHTQTFLQYCISTTCDFTTTGARWMMVIFRIFKFILFFVN